MDLLQPSTFQLPPPSLWPKRRNRGYKFESDTETETAAILAKYSQPDKRITFTTLIKTILKELEGSFAFVFKSVHYPNDIVAWRLGIVEACYRAP
ncbi:hypothetical protein BU15DRAFT_83029 [Melanogaster broomeanus]|nr:hypothetical protein BU15DRAFT_83029 [Melanogaster broomeanus]